jgi:hypothetical protein
VLILVIALIVSLGLGLAVVVSVALPARRDGRDVLGPSGEELVGSLRGWGAGRGRDHGSGSDGGTQAGAA